MKGLSSLLVCVFAASLTGCDYQLTIHNDGPNAIEITADPSPSTPELPLTIEPFSSGNLQWHNVYAETYPVTFSAVDTTTLASDSETVTFTYQPKNTASYTWDGTELTYVGAKQGAKPAKAQR